MIATEPRSPTEWKAALPLLRTYHDNRRRSHFMTFSPDGTRLLFGGRTGNLPSSLPKIALELRADLEFIFPALKDIRISHAWTGRCAATRDLYPHVGVNPQGLHYALGYCFSGNAMGPYLARKAAALILGQPDEASTVFNSASFSAIPRPARGAWLMPALMTYYAWADRPRGTSRAI
jgi:glycine/D-amino acid oxidase-like deaminating enzyme